MNAGQGCDCFFCATHDTSETIWSSSWWRTATWTRRRTPTSSPRTLSGRHIIPFSIQEKSNKMNTLLDKQYCHCCPNKSLNKKSKSLLEKPHDYDQYLCKFKEKPSTIRGNDYLRAREWMFKYNGQGWILHLALSWFLTIQCNCDSFIIEWMKKQMLCAVKVYASVY